MRLRFALLWVMALSVEAASPPLVDYVTYLGGSYGDAPAGIAVDSTGDAYVAGTTNSPDFPLTSTSLGTPSTTTDCAFVTKFNPSGTAIDFSICLANALATAFALDTAGNMYLGIVANANPYSVSYQVVKLDPTGQNILYTAPIGGLAESLVVDTAGDVYLSGTAGPGLVTTSGVYQPQSAGGQCATGAPNAPPATCNNAFITRLSPSGSVAWTTYLGGSGPDDAHAIAIDSAGNVWVAGATVSPNFPTTANAISRTFGGEVTIGPLQYGDAFVSKLDPTGSHLLYSTYLGGSAADGALGIAVDSTGAAYVAGGTGSSNFPTTAGALQTTCTGCAPNTLPSLGPDGFVTKIDSSGQLIYSTFTPAPNTPIVVDAAGQAYVSESGAAFSSTIQPTCASPQTPSVLVINATGSAEVSTSAIPGSYLALDGKGGLYSAGQAFTLAFFSTPHAFQIEYGGGNSDAFAAKVDFSQPAGPSLASVLNAANLFPGYATQYPTGAVAPGEIVTLFGNDFGSSKPAVNFGQFPAPVLYSSNCQINAVVPFEVNPGSTTLVTVESGEQTLGPIKLPVVVAAPGIFTMNDSGSGQGAILNQDSSVNSPSNPAAPGSIVSVYMTGTGALTPSIADGSLGPLTPPFPAPVAVISATIGGVAAPVTFAGQAPGFVAGATQINIQVPQNAPVGSAVPVIVYAAGYVSEYPGTTPSGYTESVTIAVH
jgi:uncharacterized protein (TIGR03437 family)